jgi:hypothetical protein
MVSSTTDLLCHLHDSAPPVPCHRDAAVRGASNLQSEKKHSRYLAALQSDQAADLQSMIRKSSIPKLLYADPDVMVAPLLILRTCALSETISEERRIDSQAGAERNGSVHLRTAGVDHE